MVTVVTGEIRSGFEVRVRPWVANSREGNTVSLVSCLGLIISCDRCVLGLY